MQYKLSKDQWLEIGKKAGWIKEAKKKNAIVTGKQIGRAHV